MSVTVEAVQTESLQGIVTSLLPASYFYDAAHYAREQELIFERSWMHVGHASLCLRDTRLESCSIGARRPLLASVARGRVDAAPPQDEEPPLIS